MLDDATRTAIADELVEAEKTGVPIPLITARYPGMTVELNLEHTGSLFDQHVRGRAAAVVPAYLDQILARSLTRSER